MALLAKKYAVFGAMLLTLVLPMAFSYKTGHQGYQANSVNAGSRFTVVFFYSDSTFTKKVGSRTVDCSGRITVSGTITPYGELVFEEPCCGIEIC